MVRTAILTLAGLGWAVAPAFGISFPVSVAGTTSTQAVITYTSPTDAACTVEVSESASYLPLVPDVDPSLFSGANLDARAGATANGYARSFVAGKRTAELASDGKLYSRALQAFTTHYVRVTCGAYQSTITFHTQNPPTGNTAPEYPPFQTTGFGNYGWPTIDWSDQTKAYVDPLTGLLVKRITAPGWSGENRQNNPLLYALDRSGNWVNPNNAIAQSGAATATYSAGSSDPLFLAWSAEGFSSFVYAGGSGRGGFNPIGSVDDVAFVPYGSATGTTTDDQTVLVCMSFDSGQTCASSEQTVVLPGTAGYTSVIPASYPSFPFSGWGLTPLTYPRVAASAQTGTVNVSGSAVTLQNGGVTSFFDTRWPAGTKLKIVGSSCTNQICTVASVVNSTALTLQENVGTLSNAAYYSYAAGFRVRKKTATGSISLSAMFNMAWSPGFGMNLNGSDDYCSQQTTTVSVDANGNAIAPVQAYFCTPYMEDGETIAMLFIPSTGESRFLGKFYMNASQLTWNAADKPSGAFDLPVSANWLDPQDPLSFYTTICTASSNGSCTGATEIVRGTYTGNFSAVSTYYTGFTAALTGSFSWTVVTPASQNLDVMTQIASKNPQWHANFWSCNLAGFGQGQIAAYTCSPTPNVNSGKETGQLINIFDLSTGLLTNATNDFNTYPAKYAADHAFGFDGGLLAVQSSITWVSNNAIVFGGPYTTAPSQVLQNGSWTSNTAIADGYADTCDSDIAAQWQALGATGQQCVKIRTTDACSSFAPALETQYYPCSWDSTKGMLSALTEGDNLWDPNSGEQTRIVKIVPYSGSVKEVTLQRKAGCDLLQGNASHYTHTNGWIAINRPPVSLLVPNADIQCGATILFTTKTQDQWLQDNPIINSHFDVGAAPTPGNLSTIEGNLIRYNQPFPGQIGGNFGVQFGLPLFNGQQAGAVSLQSYPSARQYTAPAPERRWFLDFHHLNPGLGLGSEFASSIATLPSAPALVSGTTSVYQISNAGTLDQKVFRPIGMAGRYLLKDASSPTQGNVVTDATPYTFCVAFLAGECRSGSSAGQIFVSVPQADLQNGCIVNTYAQTFPCVFTPPPDGAWTLQRDLSRSDSSGVYLRRLTMGFSGPGRQYQFGNMAPLAQGDWAWMQGYWLDGLRNDILGIKLPGWPAQEQVGMNRQQLQTIALPPIPADPNIASVQVRFGYAEYGPAASFFCTTRQEACTPGGTPIAFLSENLGWQSCTSGCTPAIPAVSGRVLYYAIDKQTTGGLVEPGATQVMVVW